MRNVEALVKELTEREAGPRATFTIPHVILALMIVGSSNYVGRQALSRELEIGEGAARTIIKRLRERGIIKTDASGCSLTSKGKKILESIQSKIIGPLEVNASKLTVGDKQVVTAVRGGSSKFKDGIEQRDKAVMHGALGATTYIFSSSKFKIPGVSEDCESDYPDNAWKEIREKLSPVDGDAIIVCGARNVINAKVGCVAAALTLI